MELIYRGNKVMVSQDETTDLCQIDFLSFYNTEKTITCHRAEVLDAVEQEFNEKNIKTKAMMKNIKTKSEPTFDMSDLDKLKKIFN